MSEARKLVCMECGRVFTADRFSGSTHGEHHPTRAVALGGWNVGVVELELDEAQVDSFMDFKPREATCASCACRLLAERAR